MGNVFLFLRYLYEIAHLISILLVQVQLYHNKEAGHIEKVTCPI